MGFFIASIQKHNWYLYINIVATDLVELIDSCSFPLHQAAFWSLSKVGLRAAVVSSSVQEYRSHFFLGPPVKLPKLSIWGIPFNYPGCPANLHASHTFWKSSIHSRDCLLRTNYRFNFFFFRFFLIALSPVCWAPVQQTEDSCFGLVRLTTLQHRQLLLKEWWLDF